MNLLWYDNPAVTWHAALPIGNGVLGGMVFGGPAADRIALNHENLWRGKTRTRTTQPVYEHLPRIRELFFQDRLVEAGEETVRYLSGKEPLVQPYQPAGDLTLYFAGHEIVSDYRRQLSLSDGVVEVGYVRHGTRFLRKYLASVEHGALAVRIEADAPASVSVRVHLDRIDDEECPCVPWHRGTRIGLSGRFIEGVCFGVEAQVVATGGKVRSGHGATLDVEQADAVTIYVRAGVGLEGEGEQRGRRDWGLWHDDLPEFEVVEHTHRAEHRALFDRVSLNLGQGEQEKPTGVRLAGLRAGNADPDLLATYFQYGRYLLMNSSRRCQQPANLQGVWNDLLRPPWNSDFHHDINIQMNYWPAEVTNLPECIAPLAQYLRRAIPEGRKAARDLYDCGGIWLPIQTDLWDRAVPDAPYWDVWTGAAAWLAQHLWWHYEYALDETFLREHAYPFMKEAAAFYEDYLVEDAKGRLVTVPSQSPENYFVGGTRPVSLCVG
ncbi:MAG: glycoside hydrolase family 95 protein, partial [Candidatus Latescibacteria bacterium]|nr:glycoside hydrolase family 95 protein [Candidatus Latescibacterota bacterium]